MTPTRSLRSPILLALLSVVLTATIWILVRSPESSDAPSPAPPVDSPAVADGERSLLPPESEGSGELPPEGNPGGRTALPDPVEGPQRFVRIVDAVDGTGVEGVRVRCVWKWDQPGALDEGAEEVRWDSWVRDLSSGPNGLVTIELARETVGPLHVFESSDPGFVLRPSSIASRAVASDPAHAPLIRREHVDGGPVLGQIVDTTDGRPIPELPIRVATWNPLDDVVGEKTRRYEIDVATEWVITDADGNFETRRSFPEGWLELSSHLEPCAGIAHVPGGPRQVIPIDAGPMIRLDFRTPAGLAPSDFIAGLADHPEEDLRFWGVLEPDSPFAGEHASSPGEQEAFAPVQGKERPWVRLLSAERQRALPAFLVLVSRDGCWYGSARFENFERHRTQPLPVRLESRTSLFGTVRWKDPIPTHDFQILLYPPDSDPEEDLEHLWTCEVWSERPATESPFLFRAVEPGTWTLRAVCEGFLPHEETIVLPPGQPTMSHEVLLEPRRVFGELRGVIRTTSGRPLDSWEAGHLRLMNVIAWGDDADADSFGFADVSWRNGVGEFHMQDLVPGEYVLRPNWDQGGLPCTPPRATASTGGDPVEFLVHDDLPTTLVRLSVICPADVRRAYVEVEWRGADGTSYRNRPWQVENDEASLDDGEARFLAGPFPRGGRVEARVFTNDYRPIWLGDEVFSGAADAAERSARVVLEPGWGARIRIVDEDLRSLAGIVLSLDGIPCPPSDEWGMVIAKADTKPVILAVETPGWELVDHQSRTDWNGSVFADTGEFTLSSHRLDVILRRR